MNELRRLHVAAIFVSFFQALKSFFLPLLFGLFLGGSREPIGFFRFEYIWIGIILLIFITGIGNWITFRYSLKDGELYIQKGIFIKKKRYIQQSRIQSIDISAGLIQRLFGLVKLKIETAGGGAEPEMELIAIHREEAEEIRSELLRKNLINHNEEEEKIESQIVWVLGRKRLLITALTSSGIGLVISAVAALFSQIEQFIPESIYENIFTYMSRSGVAFIVAIILFIFIIAWSISIIATVLKYGNFRIEQSSTEIVISRGLLERRQLTLHLDRITAVRIVRNLMRQPFGYATVYVESAGGGSKEEQLSTVLFPLIKEKELLQVFREILPEYALQDEVESVPKRAFKRAIIRMTIIPLIITLAVGIFFTPLGYYGFIIVLFSFILAYFQYKDAGANFNESHIWIRYRKVSQVTILSSRKKIQSAEMTASPFQRRKSLASFRFSVLSSFVGKTFTVVDLEKKHAERLLDWYDTY